MEQQTITEMKQIISACPSLWECKIDGVPAYIRYRWGYLAVRMNEGRALNNTEIAGEQLGDEFDGIIDVEKVIAWLRENNFTIE